MKQALSLSYGQIRKLLKKISHKQHKFKYINRQSHITTTTTHMYTHKTCMTETQKQK